MLTIRNYVKASSLEEAYELNQKKANRVMGGMMWLRTGRGSIDTLIDLSDLHLDTIEETDEAFTLGAMVTLRTLEKHESLNAYCDHAVEKAVRDIVGVQFRNGATLGGSIYGRFGFSDVLTVFLSMDSYVKLYRGGIVPLEEYAARDYDRDLVVALIVKKRPAKFSYLAMRNQRTDFPVLACSVSLMDGTLHASIGARPARAVVITGEGTLSAEEFAEKVANTIRTDSNLRGSAKYRKHLAKVLTMRAVCEIKGEA